MFAVLADDLAKMFDEAGGMNYVEYQVCSEKYGLMSVLIQRVDGETPAAQNMRLRKRIAELEATTQPKATPQVPLPGTRPDYRYCSRCSEYRRHNPGADQCQVCDAVDRAGKATP
jgi:hypothetical protein